MSSPETRVKDKCTREVRDLILWREGGKAWTAAAVRLRLERRYTEAMVREVLHRAVALGILRSGPGPRGADVYWNHSLGEEVPLVVDVRG